MVNPAASSSANGSQISSGHLHRLSRDPAVRASSFAVGEQSDDGSVVLPLNPVGGGGNDSDSLGSDEKGPDDRYNYALLIVLYTLQGIPMGLSASIPFLIQQKLILIFKNYF